MASLLSAFIVNTFCAWIRGNAPDPVMGDSGVAVPYPCKSKSIYIYQTTSETPVAGAVLPPAVVVAEHDQPALLKVMPCVKDRLAAEPAGIAIVISGFVVPTVTEA